MKNAIFAVGGFCAAAAGFLLWKKLRNEGLMGGVEQMAHSLEEAWSDHHTVA